MPAFIICQQESSRGRSPAILFEDAEIIQNLFGIANALEKPVQVSPENALMPAISRLAFTVLKGVRYS